MLNIEKCTICIISCHNAYLLELFPNQQMQGC